MESDPCSPRDCPFPTWGCNCTKNYKNLFDAYVETYTILFSLIALVSIAQLARFIYFDGCSPSIQKLLHFLFFIQGIIRVVWLQIDPHNLKALMNSYLENLGNGFGLYVIIFAYLLVVMLWAMIYKKACAGNIHSWTLQNIRGLFVVFIIGYAIVEIVLRILWRYWKTEDFEYQLILSIYYSFVFISVGIICVSFLFYGLRMYRNLLAFQINPMAKERLTRITFLTSGATILCIIILFIVLIVFVLEIVKFHFVDMNSFLIEQFIFRFLEIATDVLILYFLRQHNYEYSRNAEERSPLI